MLLNTILGGGMSSRLFYEVREKLGLAYSVYSYSGTYVNNGTLNVYIGTNPASVGKAADVAADVIADIKRTVFPARSLIAGCNSCAGRTCWDRRAAAL